MRFYASFLLLLLFLPLPARPSLDELRQPLVVKSYQIEKIYGHRLGYRVDLIDDYGRLKSVFVKNSWLVVPETKKSELLGDFILQRRIPSYMVMYSRKGKVNRFTVYVQKTFAGRDMIVPATELEATDADFDITAMQIGGEVDS